MQISSWSYCYCKVLKYSVGSMAFDQKSISAGDTNKDGKVNYIRFENGGHTVSWIGVFSWLINLTYSEIPPS
mgnify:CR=1 FL=1